MHSKCSRAFVVFSLVFVKFSFASASRDQAQTDFVARECEVIVFLSISHNDLQNNYKGLKTVKIS